MRQLFGLFVFLLAILSASGVQAASKSACSARPYHQLDFLIGDWIATSPKGLQGKVEAVSIVNGCAIRLHWLGTGYEGYATHTYDATRDLWQKAWTDDTGSVAVSTGRMRHGLLTYDGVDYNHGRQVGVNRQTLELAPDGTVRFSYATSADGGKTWKATPGLVYRKISPAEFAHVKIIERTK
jgi:hypothetical protein